MGVGQRDHEDNRLRRLGRPPGDRRERLPGHPGQPDRRRLLGDLGAVPGGHDGRADHARDPNFIFASEDGTISAWRGGSSAALVTPADGGADAVYKGLAISQPATGGPLLYATDFHNGRVDMFNGAWQNVTPPNAFLDPMLPPGYAPFGIQTIGSRVFVTYARQQAGSDDEAHGQGLGFVDAFDLDGNLVDRVAQHGQLDAPWGLAVAPATFGRFAGDLLVGNFGDGQINAYEETGSGFEHRGTLRGLDGKKLVIDGLWALEFGNAGSNGSPGTLFFTAGPDDESHGVFGTITTG